MRIAYPNGNAPAGDSGFRRGSFPTLMSEVVPDVMGERRCLAFQSWAAHNRFLFLADALPLYKVCGSAAEAYFLRPFTERDDFVMDGEVAAIAGGIRVELQAKCFNFRIDFAVSDDRTRLAVEIDGMAFHHRTKEQVAADYLRQRRISAGGYAVIRYTAHEAFTDAPECWRQMDAILAARRRA